MSGAVMLHVGCGDAPDLCAQAARVVLVEPDPARMPQLRAQIRDQGDRVQLIAAAVAPETGNAPFHRCNFAALSGLDVPEALSRLMPGLATVGSRQVATLSPADLLARADLQGAGHVLRCDAPGAVAGLLDGLQAAGALARFAVIRLVAGAEPFYGPGSAAPELIARLQRQGYRLLAREDADDPDWPRLRFQRDAVLVELQAQLAARAGALAAQEARTAEEAAARAAAETRTAQDQARIAALETELTDLRAQAAAAQEDLRLALRMQTLAAADLADLQARHAALNAERDRQDALLGQLALQLGDVSDHLGRLDAAPDKPRLSRETAAETGDS
ncbi:hypothetical protein ACFMPD_14810 [Sedimentitalea sp. HM32M-2]|uniref:hypothetical protein n=1 Tax=Sedimentitalea sp. HM32M-2 TaxID=3351566 RepID=UPI00363F277E